MRLFWTSVLAGATLATGCAADPTSPLALGSVQVVSGDGQSGTPGLPVPDTLMVKVLDQTGRSPMAGVEVRWSVQYGGGSLDRSVDTTDRNGIARAVWVLGATPGTNQAVASVGDLPGVMFTGTARGLQATTIAVGYAAACAVDIKSRTWCWGSNIRGDSSQSVVVDSGFVATQVAGGHAFIELAAGAFHFCGLDGAGAVWCWGWDRDGQLGSGAVRGAAVVVDYPIRLLNAPAFAHIFSGDGNTTCGLTADGTAWCWGDNYFGQVGSGSNIDPIPDPEPVAGVLKFVSLSPTSDHTCGIAVGGAAYCWGHNAGVLLGDSGASGVSSSVPVAVAGGHLFRTLYTTDLYNCGTASDVGPMCWGIVPDGAPPRGIPVTESQLIPLTEYRPGGFFSQFDLAFGIYGTRAVAVSADNMFDEGNPVPLHALAAGFWTACALAQDGTVYCWGGNDAGQAGSPDEYGWDTGHASAHAVTVPANY